MGFISHDAIVVTSFDRKYINIARVEALALALPVSEVVESPVNRYCSFFIAPDGSKEGWADSKRGDEAREKWLAWARAQYAKGVYIDWVAICYGGDLEEPEFADTSHKHAKEAGTP